MSDRPTSTDERDLALNVLGGVLVLAFGALLISELSEWRAIVSVSLGVVGLGFLLALYRIRRSRYLLVLVGLPTFLFAVWVSVEAIKSVPPRTIVKTKTLVKYKTRIVYRNQKESGISSSTPSSSSSTSGNVPPASSLTPLDGSALGEHAPYYWRFVTDASIGDASGHGFNTNGGSQWDQLPDGSVGEYVVLKTHGYAAVHITAGATSGSTAMVRVEIHRGDGSLAKSGVSQGGSIPVSDDVPNPGAQVTVYFMPVVPTAKQGDSGPNLTVIVTGTIGPR